MIGEPKEAVKWLEVAYSEGSGYLAAFHNSSDFYFEGVREDPDFQKFLKKIEVN